MTADLERVVDNIDVALSRLQRAAAALKKAKAATTPAAAAKALEPADYHLNQALNSAYLAAFVCRDRPRGDTE
jgi:hypothetical protein